MAAFDFICRCGQWHNVCGHLTEGELLRREQFAQQEKELQEIIEILKKKAKKQRFKRVENQKLINCIKLTPIIYSFPRSNC